MREQVTFLNGPKECNTCLAIVVVVCNLFVCNITNVMSLSIREKSEFA